MTDWTDATDAPLYDQYEWRWVKAFAWLPVKTRDMGWLWWKPYWIYQTRQYYRGGRVGHV